MDGFLFMNVAFNGYVALVCEGCQKKRTIESKELGFEQDISPEAEDDEYIRYITHVNARCDVCSTKLHVKLDVWEYPEAVANYAYYDEQGVDSIQCEFNIQHYFDGEVEQANAGLEHSGERPCLPGIFGNDDNFGDNDEGTIRFNEDNELNEVSDYEGYQDYYDEEDN